MTFPKFPPKKPGPFIPSSAALDKLKDILKNRYRTTTIDFDDAADGTLINTYYAAKGVTFQKITTQPPVSGGPVYARFSYAAETPPNVITIMQSGAECFDAYWGGIEARFTPAVCSVSIDAIAALSPEALGSDDNRPFLEIYDTSGAKKAEILYPYRYDQPGFGTWQRLSYSAAGSTIGSIRFSCQRVGSNYTYAFFDTLIFTYNLLNLLKP